MSSHEALKACGLFRDFTEEGLTFIGKICRERNIPAGSPIFVENMVAESLFIIKAGIVQLSMKSASGRDAPLEKLAPGESFGEISLIIGGTRMVTATAGTDCQVLEIPKRDFARLQKTKPQICFKLMIRIVNQFAQRVAASQGHLKPLILSQIGE